MLVLLALALVRTAWVSDDGYITLRVVDNLWSGHGLRWNVADRVQVYTHPLWMLALIPLAAVDPPIGAMALGGLLTLGLGALLTLRVARDASGAAVAGAALVGSMSFVDFSTSGLENPLTHVLLVTVLLLTAAAPTRRTLVALGLCVGLVVLNRLDNVLLVLPSLVACAGRGRRSDAVLALLLPAAIVGAWLVFALAYYGSPFPNTAYAKLGTGVPRAELVVQGLRYLENSVRWDPVTPAVLLLGLVAAARRRGPGDLAAAAGVVASLVYVVAVGGDHMSGRFLTAPFVMSLVLLVRVTPGRLGGLLAVPLAGLGMLALCPPLTSPATLDTFDLDPHGIAHERGIQYLATGLLARLVVPERHAAVVAEARAEVAAGPATLERVMVGWHAYHAGPELHIVDPVGIVDPLVARLPACVGPHRVGHWYRTLPGGYLERARVGGSLRDAVLDDYWQDVLQATRGPLLSRERWSALYRLNVRTDWRVTDWCNRRCSFLRRVELEQIDPPLAMPDHGIGTWLAGVDARAVTVTADVGRYRLWLFQRGRVVRELIVSIEDGAPARIALPAGSYSALKLLPEPGYNRRLHALAVSGREQ